MTDNQVLGAVSASHGLASQVGSEILAAGGNAFDSAVSAALATGVVEPYHCQLGGTGIINYKTPNQPPQVIQCRGKAPKNLDPDVLIKDNQPIEDLISQGPFSVIVPGILAGLHKLWFLNGKLDWSQLVKPAIRLAEDGFPIDTSFLKYYQDSYIQKKLHQFARYPFANSSGTVLRQGDFLIQNDLAETLYLIGQRGIETFYRGELMKKIIDHIQESGGVLDYHDMSEYRPEIDESLTIECFGWTLSAPGSPSLGGPQVLFSLKLLESLSIEDYAYGSGEFLHLLIETLKLSFMLRANISFEGIHPNNLDEKYINEIKKTIRKDQALQFNPGRLQKHTHSGTSHLSVVDKDNNIVSITQTVRDPFGSGIVIPGTGVLMNNQVADFIIKPDRARVGQAVREGIGNLVGPGKVPKTNMSPIIASNNRTGGVFGIGAGGGPMIICAVVQVIINHLVFGMDLKNAQQAPRIHYQGKEVEVEGWIPEDVLSKLKSLGHNISVFGENAYRRWCNKHRDSEGAASFNRVMPCSVQCVGKTGQTEFAAAADPRGTGLGIILGHSGSRYWNHQSGFCSPLSRSR